MIFKFAFIFLYTLRFSSIYVPIDLIYFLKNFAWHSMVDQIVRRGPLGHRVIWLFLPFLVLVPVNFNLQCASPPITLLFLALDISSLWPAGCLLTPSLSDEVSPMFQGQSRSHVLLFEAPLSQLPSASIALSPVLPPSTTCAFPPLLCCTGVCPVS